MGGARCRSSQPLLQLLACSRLSQAEGWQAPSLLLGGRGRATEAVPGSTCQAHSRALTPQWRCLRRHVGGSGGGTMLKRSCPQPTCSRYKEPGAAGPGPSPPFSAWPPHPFPNTRTRDLHPQCPRHRRGVWGPKRGVTERGKETFQPLPQRLWHHRGEGRNWARRKILASATPQPLWGGMAVCRAAPTVSGGGRSHIDPAQPLSALSTTASLGPQHLCLLPPPNTCGGKKKEKTQ